jgi:hypothetical protein
MFGTAVATLPSITFLLLNLYIASLALIIKFGGRSFGAAPPSTNPSITTLITFIIIVILLQSSPTLSNTPPRTSTPPWSFNIRIINPLSLLTLLCCCCCCLTSIHLTQRRHNLTPNLSTNIGPLQSPLQRIHTLKHDTLICIHQSFFFGGIHPVIIVDVDTSPSLLFEFLEVETGGAGDGFAD